MKKTIILFFLVIASSLSAAEPLVARQDFDAAPGWQLKQFSNRDFWVFFKAPHPVFSANPPESHAEVAREKVFQDCAFVYVNPQQKIAGEPVKIQDISQEKSLRPNVPFVVRYFGTRPTFKLKSSYTHDMEGYREWLAAHPDFVSFEQSEWDNELTQMTYWLSTFDPEERKRIEALYPAGKTREEFLQTAHKIHTAVGGFFFNDSLRVAYMRAGWCLDHIAAEWGAHHLVLETTNTTGKDSFYHYRWQTSMFFTRGAARQYGLPWGWYAANFYNGYNSAGEWKNDQFHNYFGEGSNFGAEKGTSQSLMEKAFYLSYLGGAIFAESEEWQCLMLKPYGSKAVLTPFGEDLRDFHAFTVDHPDRGVPYTPVALLVPFNQGYPHWGGNSWSRFEYRSGDDMVDGCMFTVIPPWDRVTEMKKGVEGALFHSPYGDIFDVLAPDVASFAQASGAYKAAILLGEYPDNREMAQNLIRYVENGGTLLINLKQVTKSIPESFLGIYRTTFPAQTGTEVTDDNGRKFRLNAPYKFNKIRLQGARAILKDDQGNILASANRYGKGQVIVTAPDYMMPVATTLEPGPVIRGERRSEFMKYFIERFSRETLPLAVTGDIQYGLNRTANGYWIYLFNNKGLYKFTDTPQTVDAAQDATVQIDFKNLKISAIRDLRTGEPLERADKFELKVPAGDFRILELQCE